MVGAVDSSSGRVPQLDDELQLLLFDPVDEWILDPTDQNRSQLLSCQNQMLGSEKGDALIEEEMRRVKLEEGVLDADEGTEVQGEAQKVCDVKEEEQSAEVKAEEEETSSSDDEESSSEEEGEGDEEESSSNASSSSGESSEESDDEEDGKVRGKDEEIEEGEIVMESDDEEEGEGGSKGAKSMKEREVELCFSSFS